MASTSSTSSRSCKYHVFLSFRGEDTRQKFTSYLYAALTRKGITTFIDETNLCKGDAISYELLTAIEDSMSPLAMLGSTLQRLEHWTAPELADSILFTNQAIAKTQPSPPTTNADQPIGRRRPILQLTMAEHGTPAASNNVNDDTAQICYDFPWKNTQCRMDRVEAEMVTIRLLVGGLREPITEAQKGPANKVNATSDGNRIEKQRIPVADREHIHNPMSRASISNRRQLMLPGAMRKRLHQSSTKSSGEDVDMSVYDDDEDQKRAMYPKMCRGNRGTISPQRSNNADNPTGRNGLQPMQNRKGSFPFNTMTSFDESSSKPESSHGRTADTYKKIPRRPPSNLTKKGTNTTNAWPISQHEMDISIMELITIMVASEGETDGDHPRAVWCLHPNFAADVMEGVHPEILAQRYGNDHMHPTEDLCLVYMPVLEEDCEKHWFLAMVDLSERQVFQFDTNATKESKARRRRVIQCMLTALDGIVATDGYKNSHSKSAPEFASLDIIAAPGVPKNSSSTDSGIWVMQWMAMGRRFTHAVLPILDEEKTRIKMAIALLTGRCNEKSGPLLAKAAEAAKTGEPCLRERASSLRMIGRVIATMHQVFRVFRASVGGGVDIGGARSFALDEEESSFE
ncbi:hypothetical protein S83_063902 [Arachis hypogaea]